MTLHSFVVRIAELYLSGVLPLCSATINIDRLVEIDQVAMFGVLSLLEANLDQIETHSE